MNALPVLPWTWPAAGGLLIGLAAGLYWLLDGRVAGVSGMAASAAGLAHAAPRDLSALFLLGLPAGAWLAQHWLRAPDLRVTASWTLLAAGGLLVGYGTRLGSGCTSGHGVCGLARLSPRSIAATAVFMAAAAATVYVQRHLAGGPAS